MPKFAVDQILESGLVMKRYVKHSSCPALTLAKRFALCIFDGVSRRLRTDIVFQMKENPIFASFHKGRKEKITWCNHGNSGRGDRNWHKTRRSIFLTGRLVTAWFCVGRNFLCRSVFVEFNFNTKKATILAYGCQTHPNMILMGVTI